MKYCEYCGCESSRDKIKCDSCGAPFTKSTKMVISKPPEKVIDLCRDAYECGKIKGLKAGKI